jgi:hypothetical protein
VASRKPAAATWRIYLGLSSILGAPSEMIAAALAALKRGAAGL